MIRTNIATELCITKGQEGTVARWHASRGKDGRPVLDTLFVKLTEPPKKVKFSGLPDNVVPITKTTVNMRVELPDDTSMWIAWSQVEVVPNFGMTDYEARLQLERSCFRGSHPNG